MKRFETIRDSKFTVLKDSDLQSVKGGGICVFCMKVDKKLGISIGTVTDKDVPLNGKN